MRRTIRQWSRKLDQRGQSAVEFLLALPLALLLLAGIFEFGRHFYTRLSMRNAVSEAARFAVTGQTLTDPMTGQPMARSTSIVQVIIDRAAALQINVTQIRLNPADGGGPGQIVTIDATYQYAFVLAPVAKFFGNGFIDFTVSAAVMNEPSF
ncbi:MAG: TadE/TadG family type IV pilus assembly protein [Gemmatimonadota bacterium]